MTAIANAKGYAWGDWALGIMRSFLSGGAAALLTGGGGALVGVPSRQVWQLMGLNFLFMGLYRMGEFLQLHGAPEQLQATLDAAEVATKEAAKQVSIAKEIAPEAINQAKQDKS